MTETENVKGWCKMSIQTIRKQLTNITIRMANEAVMQGVASYN